MTNEERNFRWAYKAVLALAKRCLADANANRENPNEWPAGQEWNDLAGSSKSIFMKKARKECGISDEGFLLGIRDGSYDVEDLYDES